MTSAYLHRTRRKKGFHAFDPNTTHLDALIRLLHGMQGSQLYTTTHVAVAAEIHVRVCVLLATRYMFHPGCLPIRANIILKLQRI